MDTKRSRRTILKLGLLAVGLALLVAPVTATAGKPQPFTLTGLVLDIDDGDVNAAGTSGRFVVKERHVSGVLLTGPGVTPGTPFELTFHANVPLLTQAGQVQGFLVADGLQIATHFESGFGGPCTPLLTVFDPTLENVCPGGVFAGIYVRGTATFTAGPNAHGVLQGWLIPFLDENNEHIIGGVGAIQIDGTAH